MIRLLVNNTLFSLTQKVPSNEKALRTIEKTGILGQFIRCVPADPEYSANIVACLQRCLQLVKKKLKSGTRTGDILDAVIARKDGPINEKAKSGLVRLQSLALLSNCADESDNVVKRCRNCDKIETQMVSALLLKCKRCKITYFCSKECQVADWKIHKKKCNAPIGGNNASRSTDNTSQTTMWAFVDSNSFNIAKESLQENTGIQRPQEGAVGGD